MPINTEFFKLAVEAAAPALADHLRASSTESIAARVIVNAYHAIVAAHQELAKQQ